MLGTARSDDGTPIAYEVRGDDSPALVFVHGWSCDRGYWKHQLPLAERHRVVTIDLAGHGDGALSEAAHSLSNMAPLLEHMPQLTAPIAAINFEWRPTDVESLARRGIRTTLMPGLGHFGMMEDPDRFNQQLEETVESFAVRA